MMRYLFTVGSRAGTFRPESVEQWLFSLFPEQGNVVLTDPSDSRIDLLCRAHCREGLRLVAVGGDGTVHRLLAAAVRYDVPIGILPCGTANDLARAIGLTGSLKECFDVICGDRTRAIDLVSVNGSLFATCGGLGLPASAAILHNRSHKGKSRLSATGYRRSSYLPAVLRAISGDHSLKVRIRDNLPRWSGPAMAIVVSNQACFGGCFSVSPGAVNTDGFFDLCVIPDPASRFRELGIVLRSVLVKGTIGPEFIHSRLHRARILTDRAVPFLGDGEILFRGNDFRIEVLPRVVRFVVPEKATVKEAQGRSLSTKLFHRGSRQLNVEPCRRSPSGRQDIVENNAASNQGPNVAAWNPQDCRRRGDAGPQL